MNFFVEEPQHCIINAEHSTDGGSTHTVHGKRGQHSYGNKREKSKSGVSCENCSKTSRTKPDCYSRNKFKNYWALQNHTITNADGQLLKALCIGIKLPNGNKQTRALLKVKIYSPDMVFTLISIGCPNEVNCSVIFQKGMCIIRNPDGCVIGTIPHADGLYQLLAPKQKSSAEHVNITAGKMSISEAHHKLGHISHTTIRNPIWTSQITGIKLNMDLKPEFCEPCAKTKSARLLVPKKSDTHATESGCIGTYGDQLPWGSVETLMLLLAQTIATIQTRSTSSQRRVILLNPINRMRHLLRCNQAI